MAAGKSSSTKTQTKSVILSVNGETDNDQILKLSDDILKAEFSENALVIETPKRIKTKS